MQDAVLGSLSQHGHIPKYVLDHTVVGQETVRHDRERSLLGQRSMSFRYYCVRSHQIHPVSRVERGIANHQRETLPSHSS